MNMEMGLTDICKWYKLHANISIPLDYFMEMVNLGLLGDASQTHFDMSLFNDLLLEKYNDEFVIDDEDKFVVRQSRMLSIQNIINRKEQIVKTQQIETKPLPKIQIPTSDIGTKRKKQIPKFKIVSLDKGKVNFIKI